MLLYELLTGQRPFENLTTTQELNKAVLSGDRPPLYEGNAEPAFPGMVDLMFDSWKQSSAERPTASEVSVDWKECVCVCVCVCVGGGGGGGGGKGNLG